MGRTLVLFGFSATARAGNRHFRLLSALRAHTKAPYKMDSHTKTRMARKSPWAARTVVGGRAAVQADGLGARDRAPREQHTLQRLAAAARLPNS